jgi:hypothetical protein
LNKRSSKKEDGGQHGTEANRYCEGNKRRCAEHRDAARRGSQSAYKAGQRRSTARGRHQLVRTPFRQTSNATLEAVFADDHQTRNAIHGDERTNHRHTHGAISFHCSIAVAHLHHRFSFL